VTTEEAILDDLRKHVERAGSMRSLAKEWGISVSYVSDCLNGRRAPGPAVLGPMGYRRAVKVFYVKVM
jgi:hypothetical protein